MPVSLLVLLRAVEPPQWQTLKVEQTGKDGIEGQQSGAETPVHCFFFCQGGALVLTGNNPSAG